MHKRTWPWLCALLLAAGPAGAGGLVVRVAEGAGPAPDAVVAVRPADPAAAAHRAAPADVLVDQRDMAFVPYVQLARPGGAAVFRNSDPTRHHVYSFSPAATFETVLGPGEQSARIPLRRDGVVAIGCNIHDQMISWLYVSDAPWLARTGADGRVRFRDLPPGPYVVRVWHPRLVPGVEAEERRVDLAGGDGDRTLDVSLRLRPDVRTYADPERADY